MADNDNEPLTFSCVSAYDGGDTNSATILRSTMGHTDTEWDTVITRVSKLFDLIENQRRGIGDDPALYDEALCKKLEAVIEKGGGALEFLPVLYPGREYKIEAACRVSWT